MSSFTIDALKTATNNSNIYGGFFVFITGVIGNILNIIIFTSLKTFRQTSAAFYMTTASIVNIFQLVVGLLSRILITGYNIDPTKTSSFICKARQFTLITTMLITFTCMCFAAIDQYLSLTHRWRHLCTVKAASRLIIVAFILCLLHGIPVLLFQDLELSSSTGQTTCGFTNTGFSIYYSRFLFPVLLGFLPLIIRVCFGILAFINVHHFNNRETPIVRLERDKQLTKMVLVEVVVDVFLTLPYSIYNHLYSSSVTFTNAVDSRKSIHNCSNTNFLLWKFHGCILHLLLCISTISEAVDLCLRKYLFETLAGKH
ncbi:hypothetical protein I4U23_029005 [Adineta vaga]|nr:hypothetical protein I4U23_029005 [Adineta vaga]